MYSGIELLWENVFADFLFKIVKENSVLTAGNSMQNHKIITIFVYNEFDISISSQIQIYSLSILLLIQNANYFALLIQ